MTTNKTKTIKRSLILTAAAASVAASTFAGIALAQGDAAPGPQAKMPPRGGMVAMFDTDKDGKISKDEFLARDVRFFDRFDTDKDGVVTKEEIGGVFAKRMEKRAERMIAPFDAAGDGQVSREEFDGYRMKRFALLDRNDDGTVDYEEMRVMGRMTGRMGPMDGHPNMRRGYHGKRHGGWRGQMRHHADWRGGKFGFYGPNGPRGGMVRAAGAPCGAPADASPTSMDGPADLDNARPDAN
ncbi:EF-hand domain-containing protein [Breoghania sp.]|uniref:EF-hand domain-containing protein n=1 Tax=Breoghania sp. TaxID=2065378 RepID=UPI002AA933AB|nr:EF-hand domain-containing protein [Breoghania sp.]